MARGQLGLFYHTLFLLVACLLVNHSPALTVKKPKRTETGVRSAETQIKAVRNVSPALNAEATVRATDR